VGSAEKEVRTRLSHIVVNSGIFGLRDQGLEQSFIDGEASPALRDIGIDSLSEMELCIGIENEFGVTIVPAELERLGTLGAVVNRILGHRRGR